jgi:hypothetical protein
MWICGETSGGGNRDFARLLWRGTAIAIAVHSLDGGQGAVVGALGLGSKAQVGSESGLFFLKEGLGDSGLGAVVMAADVFPEIAIDTPDAAEFPGGLGELLDQEVFVHVGGLVGFVEAAAEPGEFFLVLRGEEAAGLVRCHGGLSAFSPITRWRSTPKFRSVNL